MAEEYRLEYTQYGNSYYEEGKWVGDNNQTMITFTQDGLQPGTLYKFRIIPYTYGIRGRASPKLITSTSKETLCEIVTVKQCLKCLFLSR